MGCKNGRSNFRIINIFFVSVMLLALRIVVEGGYRTTIVYFHFRLLADGMYAVDTAYKSHLVEA